MEESYKKGIKAVVLAQSFVEAMDDFAGESAYKQQLKNKGNSFLREADIFLNSVYKEGAANRSVIDLIDGCQAALDEVFKNVEIVEE